LASRRQPVFIWIVLSLPGSFITINKILERGEASMSIGIVELAHVNIRVPKVVEEATKHFYTTIVGLAEIEKPAESNKHGGAWFACGAVQLHLSLSDGEANEASNRHICYRVADLAQAENQFRKADVEIIADDQPIAGCRRFYVRDPGGNLLEIAQQVL
jgi:catechol 2,3-dioxygenase-like lactoylglutathione lyase family enzyme